MTDNIYRDTEERVRNDPEFSAAVHMLATLAVTRGYTPGELKQIAFAAAVLVESRSCRPLVLSMGEWPNYPRVERAPREPHCPRCGARPARFLDGQCQACGEPSK